MPLPSSLRRLDWRLLALMALALALRLPGLGLKPPHGDEGVNGWFADRIAAQGFYAYDPANFHGPLYFYLVFGFKLLLGRSLAILRLPAALFGAAAVYLLARLKDYVGRPAAYGAALLAAVSPALVYYSRYSIHETCLLFFSLLAFSGFLRARAVGDRTAAWQLSLGLAGMIATKETFILHVACFAAALAAVRLWERRSPSLESGARAAGRLSRRDALEAAGAGALLLILLYTGFGLDFGGPRRLLASFAAWYRTGSARTGHEKAAWYWLSLIARYEWGALLGLAAAASLLARPAERWRRLVGVYGALSLAVYSAIPYKTPWCLIQLLWPFWLLGAHELGSAPRKRARAGALLLGLAASAGAVKAWTLAFRRHSDPSQAYAYVPTTPETMEALEPLLAAARADRTKLHVPINVFVVDPWPLPWILGDFTRAGYHAASVLPAPDAALVLSDWRRRLLVESRLRHPYATRRFSMRAGQDLWAYYDPAVFPALDPDRFAAFAPSPSPPPPPSPGQGLLARYYGGSRCEGQVLLEKRVASPDFEWDEARRPLPAPFCIRFTGAILVPADARWTFELSSDDGSSLAIDGRPVVDNGGAHALRSERAEVFLKRGRHALRLDYDDRGGGMILSLSWARGGAPLGPVEARALSVRREDLK